MRHMAANRVNDVKLYRYVCLLSVLIWTAPKAAAQFSVNNPIESYYCYGNGEVNCSNDLITSNGMITLTIVGSCASGSQPGAEEYAFASNCKSIYHLSLQAYAETDSFFDDSTCSTSHVGEVDAESKIYLLGALVADEYSGEDCEGNAFGSAPGTFAEGPEC